MCSANLSHIPQLSLNEKIDFFTEFYTYIKSSIPISTALTKITKYSPSVKIKQVSKMILKEIDQGKNFSVIIPKFAHAFGSAYCNLLAVGDQTGKLSDISYQIFSSLKKQRNIKRNIIKASIYPAIIFIIFCIALLLLFIVIIPKIMLQVMNMGGEIPLSLKILGKISQIFVKGWIIVLPVIGFTIWHIFMSLKDIAKKEFAINIPIFGKVIKMSDLAIFAKVFSIAYASGIPVINAYLLAGDVVENKFIKNNLLKYSNLFSSRKISEIFYLTGLFSPQTIAKIESAEMSGNMDEILNEISDDMNELLDTVSVASINAIEPILIIIIGIFVLIFGYIIFGPANPFNYLI